MSVMPNAGASFSELVHHHCSAILSKVPGWAAFSGGEVPPQRSSYS